MGKANESSSEDESKHEAVEEANIKSLLDGLEGGESVEHFKAEFEKIYVALKESRSQEKGLAKRCKELNDEIINNAAKVQTALRLSQDDQNTIFSLKNELEKSWKLIDGLQTKEKSLEEKIEVMQSDFERVSNLLESESENQRIFKSNFAELESDRNELSVKLARQEDRNAHLLKVKEDMGITISEYESSEKKLSAKVASLERLLEERLQEFQREQKRKNKINDELKECKRKLLDKDANERGLLRDVNGTKDQLESLKADLKSETALKEKIYRDYEVCFGQFQDLKEQIEKKGAAIKDLVAEKLDLAARIETRDLDVLKAKNEVTSISRRAEADGRRIAALKEKLDEERASAQVLNNSIQNLNKEVVQHKKEEVRLEAEVESLKRQITMVHKRVSLEESRKGAVVTEVKLAEAQSKSLQVELESYRKEAEAHSKKSDNLQNEKQLVTQAWNDAKEQTRKISEECRQKDIMIIQLQKKINSLDIKLRQQQQLFEQARADRNVYSKHLVEANSEKAEAKRQVQVQEHQIEQLKEEIEVKDRALVKENFDNRKIEMSRNNIKLELSRTKGVIDDHERVVQAQNSEIVKLSRMTRGLDEDLVRQKKAYQDALNERDVLSAHLIKRNDEIVLLNEKIKLLECSLRTGNTKYQDKTNVIERLQRERTNLERDLELKTVELCQLPELKQKVYSLTKQVREEQVKVKALSEELETPVNIHRFRYLENTNPELAEVMSKVNILQKRLLRKCEECMLKSIKIEEINRLCESLKKELESKTETNPSDVSEQLNFYQRSLLEKTNQMKALASELNMLNEQVSEYRRENVSLNAEIKDLKKRYYAAKKSLRVE